MTIFTAGAPNIVIPAQHRHSRESGNPHLLSEPQKRSMTNDEYKKAHDSAFTIRQDFLFSQSMYS
jgi:hypothetical protein